MYLQYFFALANNIILYYLSLIDIIFIFIILISIIIIFSYIVLNTYNKKN